MALLPGWQDRLTQVADAGDAPPAAFTLPRSPAFYADRTAVVMTAEEARAMAELARQRPVAWVGFDTEFRYDRPGVVIDKDHTAHDPRSIRPLLLSLALAEPAGPGDSGSGRLYRFVIDLRKPELYPPVRDVLRLPVCFVGHYAQAELFCLLRLGLPEPGCLWDTWVHEKTLYLGRGHKKYRLRPNAGEADEALAGEEAEQEEAFGYALVATCQRYAVSYPFAGDKDRLQRSFLHHPDDAPFSEEQVLYAAADATAAACLYPLQVTRAAQAGLLHHLLTIEMPWVVTNARMAWHGVRVDPEKCRLASEACDHHLADLRPRLEALGIPNVRSHKQLKTFFAREGLLHLFRRNGRVSFDKNQLAALQDRHPAIALIRAARRVHDLQKEKILTGAFVGADGRIHPEYRHLGTHTGRQTSRWPNLLGLGRVFRPLVVAGPGRGIGEVDWSQIEVGIAAAVYHDERLVQMFNTGDVYSAMAQDFYGDQLPEADRRLPGSEFKRKHGPLRNRMKTCTLGIIYGLTPHGLALYLGTGKAQAAALQKRFMALFSALRQALADATTFGGLRGYAVTASGLRRYRASATGQLSNWERNWLTNHPVQGSAAVVFKAAGNRLDKLYRRYEAWLIVPMHDAFVFEAPLEVLGEVADLTGRVMCEAVQEHFPGLQPKVEVNVQCPECWNKDGHADSLERWVRDPTYTF
jgi:DNA polymerase-1